MTICQSVRDVILPVMYDKYLKSAFEITYKTETDLEIDVIN